MSCAHSHRASLSFSDSNPTRGLTEISSPRRPSATKVSHCFFVLVSNIYSVSTCLRGNEQAALRCGKRMGNSLRRWGLSPSSTSNRSPDTSFHSTGFECQLKSTLHSFIHSVSHSTSIRWHLPRARQCSGMNAYLVTSSC